LALPAITRLGWKDSPGTNTLAYYENMSITAIKSYIVQAPVYFATVSAMKGKKFKTLAPGILWTEVLKLCLTNFHLKRAPPQA